MTCVSYDADFTFDCPDCGSEHTTEFSWDVVSERLFKNPSKSYICCECRKDIPAGQSHWAGRAEIFWVCREKSENHIWDISSYGKQFLEKRWLHQCDTCREIVRDWNIGHFKRCEIPYNCLVKCLEGLAENDNEDIDESLSDKAVADLARIRAVYRSVPWWYELWIEAKAVKIEDGTERLPVVDWRGKPAEVRA